MQNISRKKFVQDTLAKKRKREKKTGVCLTNAWGHHPFIVIWVNADTVTLEVECILAVLHVFQLVFVQIGPPP